MTGKIMTEEEIANLSDEEMMGMAIPPVMAAAPPSADEGHQEEGEDAGEAAGNAAGEKSGEGPGDAPGSAPEAADAGDEDEGADEDAGGDDGDDAGKGDDAPNPLAASDDDTPAPGDKPKAEEPAKAQAEEGKKDDKAADEGVKPEGEKTPEAIDYKAAYEKIMAPFKANGKEIKLDNPDEVIRLMQMGANYTKKLQALQPNLKLLKMLQNNDLLDESKLSFLIDLEKKNPAAIQKFLKDGNIDPIEIDTASDPNYTPGNYAVSDEEMTFTTTLEEVSSDDVGKAVIIEINKTWDARSKKALWEDPEILRVMADQKKQGIYDTIASEIERQRVLGTLSANTPFLAAYKSVGDDLAKRGLLGPKPQEAPTAHQQEIRQPVETRTASTSKKVVNDDKARAAAPARSGPKKVQQDFNPLAMSDEDFEKAAALSQRL